MPSATKIQKVPAFPALDFLAISHMIKNKNKINAGNNPYNPILVISSDEMASIIWGRLFGKGLHILFVLCLTSINCVQAYYIKKLNGWVWQRLIMY